MLKLVVRKSLTENRSSQECTAMSIKKLATPFKMRETKTGRVAVFDRFVSAEVMNFERYEGKFQDNDQPAIYRPWDMKNLFDPKWSAMRQRKDI